MKTRCFFITIATLLMALPMTARPKKVPTEKDMGAYLMVYHKDDTHGLYMAVSYDGREFTDVNNGKPVMAGDTIAMQKGIRDPHIFRGPDGAFYIAMTDLHVFAQRAGFRDTEWERDGKKYGWGNNRGLVLLKSWDLINWSRANIRFDTLDPSLAEIGCVWAPETTYDYDRKKLMIYFTMRFGTKQNRLYYCYINDDFNKLETMPQILFEHPKKDVTAIDGDITYVDGTYHLFYCSHEGTAGIKQATSTNITGPWTYDDKYYDFEKYGCEAPHVFKLIGEDKWVLMYDCYRRNPHNFGFAETSDFKTFTDLKHFDEGVMKRTNFSEQKHGAVTWLTKKEAKRLVNHFKKLRTKSKE